MGRRRQIMKGVLERDGQVLRTLTFVYPLHTFKLRIIRNHQHWHRRRNPDTSFKCATPVQPAWGQDLKPSDLNLQNNKSLLPSSIASTGVRACRRARFRKMLKGYSSAAFRSVNTSYTNVRSRTHMLGISSTCTSKHRPQLTLLDG